ncbi:hypothetical protein [Phenylobacterium ferrooxidans]|uniref:Uncharacterized protein n=1 Tax=Phenylobacterium ferrooxidans TaxID=2982689 RepID=A0ABW6CJA1_9CAUL
MSAIVNQNAVEAIALWALGDDTGISSKNIARACLGAVPQRDADIPWDIADLGRCLRLITAVPEARAGVTALGKKSAAWDRLDKVWDEMTVTCKKEGDLAGVKPGFGRTGQTYPLTYAILKRNN